MQSGDYRFQQAMLQKEKGDPRAGGYSGSQVENKANLILISLNWTPNIVLFAFFIIIYQTSQKFCSRKCLISYSLGGREGYAIFILKLSLEFINTLHVNLGFLGQEACVFFPRITLLSISGI